MEIGIVGGGINGLCCALRLAERGDRVCLYERDMIMSATSSASSKLLHGGLRYLENGEFRLVREALREREAWIRRVPEFASPIRFLLPLYKSGRRSSLILEAGLFLYDRLGGMNLMPKAKKLSIQEVVCRARSIRQDGLTGGFEFSDAQMNDYSLGRWVASEAEKLGVLIYENTEVHSVDLNGTITTTVGDSFCFDRVLNVAGPWTEKILHQSGIDVPYKLDLIRGSHLVLTVPCMQPCLLEIPGERRIFFVLPWEGKTLLGTTEIRQSLEEPIKCGRDEQRYLLDAYRYYFPETDPVVTASFAGLRPLLKSSEEPGKATREYAIHKRGRLLSVFGGKWTTAMALAEKVTSLI